VILTALSSRSSARAEEYHLAPGELPVVLSAFHKSVRLVGQIFAWCCFKEHHRNLIKSKKVLGVSPLSVSHLYVLWKRSKCISAFCKKSLASEKCTDTLFLAIGIAGKYASGSFYRKWDHT